MVGADGTLEEKRPRRPRSRKLEADRPRRRRVAGEPRPGRDRRCAQRRRRRDRRQRVETIGRATNNVAEYRALILGIERARRPGRHRARPGRRLGADRQAGPGRVQGQGPEHEADCTPRSTRRCAGFDAGRSATCKREQNAHADRLVNEALDAARLATLAAAATSGQAPGPLLYFRLRAAVAQLARASACHAEGRGFESHQPLPVGSARRCPSMCGEALRSKRHGNGGPREGFRSSPVLA